ncbi:MAG: signal transduction histidine kinase LytS [Gemmatimonadetes bacterium]|nr:signal transduction histidine kinase LytS [Gemmatimonadota bacterium]
MQPLTGGEVGQRDGCSRRISSSISPRAALRHWIVDQCGKCAVNAAACDCGSRYVSLMKAHRLIIPVVLWSIPACLMILQMQASAYVAHKPWYSLRATIPAMAEWLVWAPVTPLVLALVRKFPVWPRVAPRAVLVHALGIIAATLLRGMIYSLATLMIGKLPQVAFAQYFIRVSIGWLPSAALVYGAIVVAAVALHYSREASASAIRAAELETSLSRAESASIRAQLDPHFLFNSLHSAGALVRAHDVNGAVQMLSDIGELLRESFARRGVEYGRLRHEIAFAKRYLAIEQVRFRDRLVIEWDVDSALLDAMVPRSILQPIVENAIRHGISKRTAAGRIAASVVRREEALRITVRDDGPGFDGGELTSDGVGLSATRTRLALLYGDAASMVLSGAGQGGAVVEITLPYRTS